MKGIKAVAGLLAITVALPIWFYILYQILTAIDADKLTWFLYWAYLPVSILITFVAKLLDD